MMVVGWTFPTVAMGSGWELRLGEAEAVPAGAWATGTALSPRVPAGAGRADVSPDRLYRSATAQRTGQELGSTGGVGGGSGLLLPPLSWPGGLWEGRLGAVLSSASFLLLFLLPASGGSCGVSSLSAAPGAAAFLLAALKRRLLRSCGSCKWGGPCGSGVGWGGCFCLGWGCSSLWAVATAAGAVSATGCCLWVKWDGDAVGWSRGGAPNSVGLWVMPGISLLGSSSPTVCGTSWSRGVQGCDPDQFRHWDGGDLGDSRCLCPKWLRVQKLGDTDTHTHTQRTGLSPSSRDRAAAWPARTSV